MPKDLLTHSRDDRPGRARALCCGLAPDEFPSHGARPFARCELPASASPLAELLLLGAAASFKVGVLLGGSPHAFATGVVCLMLSLATLLDSRLRARPARVAHAAHAGGRADAARRGR